MLMDSVFTIRETALQSLIEISQSTFSTDWLLRIMTAKIQEFAKHDRFMIRIQAIHFINRLKDVVTKDCLNK